MVTDIPLTFMCDNKGFVLNLFNDWTKNIINYGNPNNDEHARNGSNQGLFEVAYRDNYLCKIEIHTYDQTQKEIQTYYVPAVQIYDYLYLVRTNMTSLIQ